MADEVKISPYVDKQDLKGLITFSKEVNPRCSIVVALVDRRRVISLESGQEIYIYPVEEFLKELWAGRII